MKQGTFSKDKHEILFQRFKINYDKEDEVWKKGSVVYRKAGTGTIFRSLMLTIINSSRISKQPKDQYRITSLVNRQMTKRRRSPCQKHEWKRKERESKRPGLWSSMLTLSRTNSGKTIHRFWSDYMRELLQHYLEVARTLGYLVSTPVTASFSPSARRMILVSLLQLLHLQIMADVPDASRLS
jgi:hypothetical protein